MDKHSNDIARYHAGKMTAAERHALEKKALSDPFLADALEGAEQISSADFAKDIEALDSRIKGAKPVFTPLRIAAGIALLIATGWIGLYLMDNNEPTTLTLNKQQPEDLSRLGAKDSAAAEAVKEAMTEAESTEDATKDKLIAQDRVSTENEASRQRPAAKKLEEQREESKPAGSIADSQQPLLAEELSIRLPADSVTSPTVTALRVETITSGDSRAAGAAKMKSSAADDLERARARKEIPARITGKVTLADDGLALPGVSVRVKGSSQGAVTDFNGAYSIETTIENPTLVFSFIGMQTKEASASPGAPLDVALTEDVSQLSEVVVTGRKIPADTDDSLLIKLAEPVGGVRAYDKYLDSNLRYPQQALDNNVKGRVTIQFTVGLDGKLNEFTVMKSLGFGCDEEVIRLVKEGPAWNPSTENSVPMESLVRVRMKFDASKAKQKK